MLPGRHGCSIDVVSRAAAGLMCRPVDTAARPVAYSSYGSGREAEPIGTDVGGVLQ